MLADGLFSKHHIGGRDGHGGFPSVPPLHGSIASTTYEADSSCCAQVENEQKRAGYAHVQVVAECVARARGRASLNVNYDPYTSSLMPLNPAYAQFYADMGQFDYTYSSAMRPVKRIEVSAVALDDVRTDYPIDFLSLDTQGSELEILRGGERVLDSAIGIETEVSFRPVYEGSPLFGDIDAFLGERGFEFICFTDLTLAAPRTLPLAGRARKLHTFGDALFLRRPQTLGSPAAARKLVFAALAYGQLEHAAWCAEKLALRPPTSSSSPVLTWSAFVDRFTAWMEATRGAPRPPDFSQVMTLEQSFRRFDADVRAKSEVRSAGFARRLARKLPPRSKAALRALIHPRELLQYYFGAPSELETLFQSVGLNAVATDLRRSRLRAVYPLHPA